MGDEKIDSYTILRYAGPMLPHGYKNLILSKWMKSYRYGNDYIKLTNPDSYFAAYSKYISLLLSQSQTLVRLAVLSDDNDVTLGFSVSRNRTLDYIHVHKDFRRQGIGRMLWPSYVDSFTHLTKIGLKLWSTKCPGVIFDPFFTLSEEPSHENNTKLC
jgi:hypothetical protein